MKRTRGRRMWGAIGVALLCIVALALWQWQTLARLAVTAVFESFGHVRVSFGASTITANQSVFRDLHVTSFRNEPIAEIARLKLTYNLRDLLPGGKRRFGLESVEIDRPHVTIIRRPDGTYNVPIPKLQPSGAPSGPPLRARVRLHDGAVDVIDESRAALANQRHLYVRDLRADADIVTDRRSNYRVVLRYGETSNRFYPVRGDGIIDLPARFVDQRWTALELPIAAAVNFIANSTTLRLYSGRLERVDMRYFGVSEPNGPLTAHLAGSAALRDGRIAITGLSQPIAGVRGPVEVYDDGLLTPRLDASIAGIPAVVSGGIFGLRSPQMRVAVRGSGDLATLRRAFAQATRLPMHGFLDFALLAEGAATKPVVWIHLHSPAMTYAASSLDRVDAVLAFNGREIDVTHFGADYQGVGVTARGRIALQRQPKAIEMLVGVHSPPRGAPYLERFLPGVPLNAIALATAEDPKAIGLRGALWGSAPGGRVGGVFNVDSRGIGTIGPLEADAGNGSVYARVVLDQPHRTDYGIVEAQNFPIAPARATVSATLLGSRVSNRIDVDGVARVAGSWGNADAHGTIAMRYGAIRGAVAGNLGDEANFGATIAGTPRAPRISGTVVVAGERYRNFDVNGNAGFSYQHDALHVHDTAVAVGPLFLALAGTVTDLMPTGRFSPHYDLAAQIHSSNMHALIATVQPRAAGFIQGSIDADVVLRGTGRDPSFAGTIDAPEGSVNGLTFRDLSGDVTGTLAALSLTRGHVVVGSSPIAMSATASTQSAAVAVDAPCLNLADFNDFFDAGDMFAGVGSLALQARVNRTRIEATNGIASFSNARFRRIALGNVAARWTSSRSSIISSLRFGGPTGEIAVAGSVAPVQKSVNLNATARGVDLGTWLPMLGLSAPITGRLDAETSLAGAYPDIAMRLHAALYGGTAGRLTIDRFDVVASALHGRGRIESAVLDLPSLSNVASGTFGLRPRDPLSLTVSSTSPDIGDFLERATGKRFAVSGSLASTLRIEGIRDHPLVRDNVVLQTIRYHNLTIPRVAGEVDVDPHSVALRNGELDLERGKALLSGAVPIVLSRSGIAPGTGPILASLLADDIELSNLAPLLPKGTQISGRIDGRLNASGTRQAPDMAGTLTLRDGTFTGPIEKSPITGIAGDLSFVGTQARLQSHAFVGGGAITASATASLPDLSRPAATTFTGQAVADNARFDIPSYFQGNIKGNVSVARRSESAPTVSGDISVYNARIPLTAFLTQKRGTGAALPINVAFQDLSIAVGPNVRVQNANVDIGATGAVRLGGTLAAPSLGGAFHSTGGSLSFYRSFNVERGDVTFDPGGGLIPDVNAVATTFVPNPATAVRLHVTGPVTDMNLDLASDPPYSKQQILGLLVGAQQFGAVQGVQSTGTGGVSAGSALQGVALGQLNTVFTRNILEPLSASLGNALGFTEVQITSDLQTGVGVNAVKAFGKYVNAIWSQSFGYPKTQAIALEAHPNAATGLRLTAYSSQGPTLFALQSQPQPIGLDVLNLNPLTAFTPISGSNGVSFSYQRKFP